MSSRAPKSKKPVNAPCTPTAKPEKQYFAFVYRYEVPMCIRFEVEACSEHEAEQYANAALDRGLFSGMEGDPVIESGKTQEKLEERMCRSLNHTKSTSDPSLKLRLQLSEEPTP